MRQRRPTRPRLAAAGLLAGAAAAAAGAAAATDRGRAVDRRLFALCNADHGAAVDRLFRGVTEFGAIASSGAAALVLATTGRRREGRDAFAAAAACWAVGQVAKRAIRRPRPGDHLPARRLIDRPTSTSWPSTHPSVILAFVTVAGRDLGLPRPARGAAAALAGAVGLSRVHNGVHWPSDVAAGLLLGRSVADLWSALISPRALRRGSRRASAGAGGRRRRPRPSG